MGGGRLWRACVLGGSAKGGGHCNIQPLRCSHGVVAERLRERSFVYTILTQEGTCGFPTQVRT